MSKRIMKRLLPLFTLLLFFGSSVMAQQLSEWINAADAAYAKEDYYSAYRYYDVALKYDTSRMDLWYRLGESAQEFTAYTTAQKAYLRVHSSEQRDSFPLLTYRIAQVLQKKGLYREASNLYEQFVTSDPDGVDPVFLDEAEKQRINAEWAADVATRPAETTVRHQGDEINSPNNDFAPFYHNDTLFFSSLRYFIKKDSILPRRSLARIFYQKPGAEKIDQLPKSINQPGRMAAHSAFDKTGNTVYFTLCDYKGGTQDFRCEIYSAMVANDGEWGIPKRLPLNDALATNTQPSVGVDPATNNPFLYFASDRQGGKGGLDIYRAEILPGGLCGPVEAVDVANTNGNDVTPFYYAPTQSLYFSTDGRLTMGGYDVYRTSWNGRGWDRPTHMSIPVNSSYNDLYYSRFPGQEQAYFASNRPDSLAIFWDDGNDACCNDIYSVGITDEIKLLALTFHALELTELPGASVALYELNPGGRRLVDSIQNPTANDFNFLVIPGKQYELVATKPGFTVDRDTLDLTDPELTNKKEIERRLYLSPDLKLDVFTFNKLDSTALIGTTVYLYEYLPDGELVLVDSIVNPSGNDHHFNLKRGNKYEVFARKDGYLPATKVSIDTNDPKLAEVSTIRRDLYLEPGLVLEVYTYRLLDKLPLTGSTVYLYEYTDEEGEVLVDSTTNFQAHQFGFIVKKGKRYVIRGEREGYGPALTSLDLSGPEVPETGTYRKDLYLGQLLEIFTFDANTELPLPGAEVRLIDPKTGEVVAEKINPEGNDFRFSINLDHPYQLEVSRKGYKPVTDIISFSPADLDAGGGKISFDVYLEPYDDPNSMLPLYLYYDNDYPNPGSRSPTTDVEYVSTNVEYYKKKQNFIQNFTAEMELEEAFRTRRRFNDFFNLEVRGGRYDLEEFSKRLLAWLDAGNTFELDLKGFASPRAGTVYNEILSARRIQAVKNFFDQYKDGELEDYRKIGALRFNEQPLGETQADPRVTDKLDDPKNSIFNLFASLERRVEVRSAESNKEN
jgi:hypothetical protein